MRPSYMPPVYKSLAACVASLAALTAVPLPLQADAEIRWLHKDYDFGLMREEAGPKTGTSSFINLGPDSISIFSVKPSCGCTSADFSDAPIAPGDTAFVSYTYDPRLRPGKFEKSVKVRLSDGRRHTIHISGNVLGTPESVATLFPFDAGPLKLSESVLNAGTVQADQSPILFVNAYSMPIDSISPVFKSSNQALVIQPNARKVGPGEVSAFSMNLNAAHLNAFGPIEIPVTLTPDPNQPDESYTLTFKAFITPDPKRLAASQNGKHPRATLQQDPIQITQGATKAYIQITNDGKGPLQVLNVSSPSEAIKADKLPKPIKPGKSTQIELTIDPENLPKGPNRTQVDIITNDPDHPHQKATLTTQQ